jgi:hypothetical protein
MFNRLMIEDPAKPKSVRFLNVLQGADSGGAPLATSLVTSDSGVAMQGAVAGTFAVMFTNSIVPMSTTTSFVIPSGVTKLYVTGLSVNGHYTVTQSAVAGGTRFTIATGGSSVADAGGVLVI